MSDETTPTSEPLKLRDVLTPDKVASMEASPNAAPFLEKPADDFVTSWENGQKLISTQKDQLVPVLPENPTTEQLAEYRQKMGVPDTPDKYEVPSALAELRDAAHKANLTPAQLKQFVDPLVAKQEEAEKQRSEWETQLREAFGDDLTTAQEEALKAAQESGAAEVLDKLGLMGHPGVVKALKAAWPQIRPDANPADPGTVTVTMSPQAAAERGKEVQSQMMQLQKGDPKMDTLQAEWLEMNRVCVEGGFPRGVLDPGLKPKPSFLTS